MEKLSKLKGNSQLRVILRYDDTREEIMRLSVDNPKVIQSYFLTSAIYRFTLWERRIMYAIIEAVQPELDGQILKGHVKALYAPKGKNKKITDIRMYLKVSDIMEAVHDTKNQSRLRDALSTLASKRIDFCDGKTWISSFGIVDRPIYKKSDRYISFILDPLLYDIFRNFTKGFTKYDLRVVRSFNSTYSMCMYEFVMHWKYLKEKTITLSEFRDSLGVDLQKHKKASDFKISVLEPVYNDLKSHSPWYFEYEEVKEKKAGRGRKRIVGFVFTFYQNKDHKLSDADLEEAAPLTIGTHPLAAYMSSFCYRWFKLDCLNVIGGVFTDSDLKAGKNIKLWQSYIDDDISIEKAIREFISMRQEVLNRITSPEGKESERKKKRQGYVITYLRNYLLDTLKRRDSEVEHSSKQAWLNATNSEFNAGFHQRLVVFKANHTEYASVDTSRLREGRFTLNRKSRTKKQANNELRCAARVM